LPDLTIGVVVATRMDNSRPAPEVEHFLVQTLENLRRNFPTEKIQDHPRIKPWRAAFSKLGLSGSKFPSSIESMGRRIVRGDPFPRINPLVDLYNNELPRFRILRAIATRLLIVRLINFFHLRLK